MLIRGQPEDENRKLKQIVAVPNLDKQMLQEVLQKSRKSGRPFKSRCRKGLHLVGYGRCYDSNSGKRRLEWNRLPGRYGLAGNPGTLGAPCHDGS